MCNLGESSSGAAAGQTGKGEAASESCCWAGRRPGRRGGLESPWAEGRRVKPPGPGAGEQGVVRAHPSPRGSEQAADKLGASGS